MSMMANFEVIQENPRGNAMTEAVLETPVGFRGPNSGIVAAVFAVLFFAGLMPVTAFGGMPVQALEEVPTSGIDESLENIVSGALHFETITIWLSNVK
jgi:hypothetical protein